MTFPFRQENLFFVINFLQFLTEMTNDRCPRWISDAVSDFQTASWHFLATKRTQNGVLYIVLEMWKFTINKSINILSLCLSLSVLTAIFQVDLG